MSQHISRRLAWPWLTLGALLTLSAAPVSATLFVRLADADLVDVAPIIVRGTLHPLPQTPAQPGRAPYTFYRVEVDAALRGAEAGATLEIKVPGGLLPNGIETRPAGAPTFAAGDEALLFLHQATDGSLRILHFHQGAFHLLPYREDRVALRHFGDAVEVSPPSAALDAETPRDLRRFERWIADRIAGRVRAADYFLDRATLRDFGAIAARFTFIQDTSGNIGRWPEFSGNAQVTFFAHERPQPGLAGGGYPQLETALAAWVDDGGSNIRLRYGGTTTSTAGFRTRDGINTIVFDDFDNAADGYLGTPFDCDLGRGTLAIAYPWPGGTHLFGGLTFRSITEGDIITNKGLACWEGILNRSAEMVWAHEVGHTLGLGHSCGSNGPCDTTDKNEALMRSFAHRDNRGARLGADDRRAIAFLYGAPDAPGSLVATAFGNHVDLSWSDRSGNEAGFVIRRRQGNAVVYVGDVGPNVTFFTDRSGAAGQTYTYLVQAVNEIGASADAEATVTTQDRNAPTQVTQTASTAASVDLSWLDNATGETGFEIWGHLRIAGKVLADELFATLPANTTSATVTGLIADSEYSFKVRALGLPTGNTAFSPAVVSTTGPAPIAPCVENSVASCLQNDRFKVEVRWKDFAGVRGQGQVVPVGAADSGIFYFFSGANWEMLVKVLDGCAINQHHWVFAAATTTVEVTLIVTDSSSGKTAVYHNPLGQAAAAVTDIEAFAGCGGNGAAPASAAGRIAAQRDAPQASPASAVRAGNCQDGNDRLCLLADRFEVKVEWTDFGGQNGDGKAVPVGTADSGLFYFFSPDNWEMLVKVLDGCALNQKVWVYAAATTNVAYTLTVRDTVSGEIKTYQNPLGQASDAITDSAAFSACPPG